MPTLEEFRALFLEKVDAFNRRDWDEVVEGPEPIELNLAQLWEFEGDEAIRNREFSNFSDALTAARQ